MSSNDESEEMGKLTRKKSLKNVAPPTYIPQTSLNETATENDVKDSGEEGVGGEENDDEDEDDYNSDDDTTSEEARAEAAAKERGLGGEGEDEDEEYTYCCRDDDDYEDNVAMINSVMAGITKTKLYDKTANYYDWKEIYPQLKLLQDNIEDLKNDAKLIDTWIPWPEDHYTKSDGGKTDWTVFPFLHTFPATNTEKSTWIGSTNELCEKTSALLKQIPGIRTALFSRLGAETKLSLHTGWEDLANHVLRCHINIKIPQTHDNASCGLHVNGEIRLHVQDEIIVFDDSKIHGAFNDSKEERIVLIVDIIRPSNIPLGRAKGGHTEELDAFVSQFK